MKKFRTIALTLLAFVLSISVFTGCGKNEMANLNEVDFSSAQQVTLDEVSTKLTSEDTVSYTSAEFSLNANINSESDDPINVKIDGKVAMTIPTILTSPEEMLNYINAEANATITHQQDTASVNLYIFNKTVYLKYNNTKVKANLMKLIQSLDIIIEF